ncbi:unnamed protein product [Polarella glacialis]|uniref:Amine oxidase n=1 Tax=Polarella glacialis TaxID=89957 RepID=A0A813JHM0_POLGL|nr:unnamed protein product [Polarella glacialis]
MARLAAAAAVLVVGGSLAECRFQGRPQLTVRRAGFGKSSRGLSGGGDSTGGSGGVGSANVRQLREKAIDSGGSSESRTLPGSKPTYDGPPVAVVGGGLAGLACGLALRRLGVRAAIFDTGKRAPGGRASSKTFKRQGCTHIVDHAAQAFTAQGPEIRALVEEMEQEGVVQQWRGRVGSLSNTGQFTPRDETREGPLWIGSSSTGMAAVPTWLAAEQEVFQDVWVAKLEPVRGAPGAGWVLKTPKGKQLGEGRYSYVVMAHNGKCADRLINTLPEKTVAHAPLRCKFTAKASPTSDRLELSSLWVCILAVPRGSSPASFDGAFVESHAVLSWAGNNSAKYPRPQTGQSDVDVWTLISTAPYGSKNKCSQEFIPPEVRTKVSEEMRNAFCTLLGAPGVADSCEVLHMQLWGAAVPLNVCQQHFVHDAEARVGICGDWLTAPSVEGAMFSGLALADAVARELRGESLPSTPAQPFKRG